MWWFPFLVRWKTRFPEKSSSIELKILVKIFFKTSFKTLDWTVGKRRKILAIDSKKVKIQRVKPVLCCCLPWGHLDILGDDMLGRINKNMRLGKAERMDIHMKPESQKVYIVRGLNWDLVVMVGCLYQSEFWLIYIYIYIYLYLYLYLKPVQEFIYVYINRFIYIFIYIYIYLFTFYWFI